MHKTIIPIKNQLPEEEEIIFLVVPKTKSCICMSCGRKIFFTSLEVDFDCPNCASIESFSY